MEDGWTQRSIRAYSQIDYVPYMRKLFCCPRPTAKLQLSLDQIPFTWYFGPSQSKSRVLFGSPSIFCLASYSFCDTPIILSLVLPSLLSFRYLFVRYTSTSIRSHGIPHGRYLPPTFTKVLQFRVYVRLRSKMPLSTAGHPDSNRHCHVTELLRSEELKGAGCRRLGTTSFPRFSRNN